MSDFMKWSNVSWFCLSWERFKIHIPLSMANLGKSMLTTISSCLLFLLLQKLILRMCSIIFPQEQTLTGQQFSGSSFLPFFSIMGFWVDLSVKSDFHVIVKRFDIVRSYMLPINWDWKVYKQLLISTCYWGNFPRLVTAWKALAF